MFRASFVPHFESTVCFFMSETMVSVFLFMSERHTVHKNQSISKIIILKIHQCLITFTLGVSSSLDMKSIEIRTANCLKAFKGRSR